MNPSVHTLLVENTMIQKCSVGLLVLILTIMFSLNAFAQSAGTQVKKETKPSVVRDAGKVNSAAKDAKGPTKPATMKYVSCSQAGCGFWAKSHSARELRYIMKRHSKKYHKVELTDNQVKEMVKKEGAK
jgi:predicted small metal-binding protein